MTQQFFDIADAHIMAETTREMVTDPSAYQMHLSFKRTIANRNKMSMFTYSAHDDEWKKLIDLAAKQGYTKFFVTDDGGNTAGLPRFFEDMVGYIAAINNGTDWMDPEPEMNTV